MLSDWFAERGVAQSTLRNGEAIAQRFSDPRQEHLSTRRSAGLFDFSFMGGWEIAGRDALPFAQRLQTRDLKMLPCGRVAYTLLCREDGSVLIDATVWCHDPHRYWIFTGRRPDYSYLASVASGFDVDVTALVPGLAVIALQGPSSFELVEKMAPGAAAGLPYFGFRRSQVAGLDAWIARLGYTGEIGYEILVDANDAVPLWQRIVQSAHPGELIEAGWESANSLRIEAGFVHFDHELAGRVFPAELSLARLVSLDRTDFIGRDALLAMRYRTPERVLAGLALDESGGYVREQWPQSRRTIHPTSEAFSPVFEQRLALAFVSSELSNTSVIYTDSGIRGRVTKLPFFDPPRVVPRRAPRLSARLD